MQKTELKLPELPETVRRIITDFVQTAEKAFENDLRSIVLYGSGAEGKLRATSDVNLILVLSALDHAKMDRLRGSFQTARAAIQLTAMFLLEDELKPSIESFSVKFTDILHRHKVLYGDDLFAKLIIPRQVTLTRLRQVLLNLSLRLREQYMTHSPREDELVLVIADVAGPLRACAATLLELREEITKPPKEALLQVASSLSRSHWEETLCRLSQARETRSLPPGTAGPTLFSLIDLANRMRTQVETLS